MKVAHGSLYRDRLWRLAVLTEDPPPYGVAGDMDNSSRRSPSVLTQSHQSVPRRLCELAKKRKVLLLDLLLLPLFASTPPPPPLLLLHLLPLRLLLLPSRLSS